MAQILLIDDETDTHSTMKKAVKILGHRAFRKPDAGIMNRLLLQVLYPIKKRRGWLLLLPMIALYGCTGTIGAGQATPVPTQHLPTVIALTVEALNSAAPAAVVDTSPPTATHTPVPTRTTFVVAQPVTPTRAPSTPTLTSRPPTATRTATSTPEVPIAEIQIFRPGPASKIISPLKLNAYLAPGAKGNVQLELFGEDGRLLVRKILSYSANPGARVYVVTDMAFEISAVAEAARLVITTFDSFGRAGSVDSVDLILLSMGEEDINPPGDLLEPIVLREPTKNILIQGGSVKVAGLARPTGKEPLLVEMLTADGKQIGPTRLVSVSAPPDGSHVPFSVEAPYSITEPTWVRVIVLERDHRIPGTIHLSSVEVLLSP